jgi:hypothetical protein
LCWAFAFLPNVALALDESKILDAMRRLKAAWQHAIAEQRPIVWKCGDNGYAVYRPQSGSVFDFDVRRTNSLTAPFVGTIKLKVVFEGNADSPAANGGKSTFDGKMICFQNIKEALENTKPKDFTKEYRADNPVEGMTISYSIGTDVAKLTGTDGGGLMALILGHLLRPENSETWKLVVGQSVK